MQVYSLLNTTFTEACKQYNYADSDVENAKNAVTNAIKQYCPTGHPRQLLISAGVCVNNAKTSLRRSADTYNINIEDRLFYAGGLFPKQALLTIL